MKNTPLIDGKRITSMMVRPSDSILESIKAIDLGAAQICLVVDDNRKLLGVVTDGVLRRAIISGTSLDAKIESVVKSEFRSVQEGTGRTEALDLMKCFSIEQLPVLNEAGQVCGMHLLNELIQPRVIPNAAMILAGGKGTRLGSLTKSTPKPMIKVAGRPILERIVLHLVGGGVRNIFLSVNYLADQIEDYFEDGSKFGCKINYLREDKPLGTGGPLALLNEYSIEDPVIVMNGDLITEFDVNQIFQQHQQNKNSITIGVRTYSHNIPFGCVRMEGNQVVSLVEKPTHQETINTGVYVISPEMLGTVPLDFFPITNLIENALSDGRSVGVFDIESWIDVGQPKQLAEARGEE